MTALELARRIYKHDTSYGSYEIDVPSDEEFIIYFESMIEDYAKSYYSKKNNELTELRDALNEKVIAINTGILKDDMGILETSDIFQTKSFSRGETVGLIIARDRINKLLKDKYNE